MRHVDHHSARRQPWLKLVAVLASLALLLGAGAVPAAANVRIEGIAVPFYARIAGPAVSGGQLELFRTDEWAAIPFYRPPECVPADFNLLNFFDVPGAFGCNPMTITQDTIWRNGPEVDAGPIHARSFGLGAVPVWIVGWPELQGAIADGELTIGELAALPSLVVGSATFYSETLHPGSAAQVPRAVVVASGSLDDGRNFRMQGVESSGELIHVRIEFR